MAELSTLARPYARAAFEYAVAAKQLQAWSDGLKTAAIVVVQPPVVSLLSSPSTTGAEQSSAMLDICGTELSVTLQNLVVILSENRRIQLLPQISQQFEALKANHEKAIDVEVISASDLDAEQQRQLSDALAVKLERNINMKVRLDKSLIGGAVIRAGDTVIDGSIRGRLTKLAESLNS